MSEIKASKIPNNIKFKMINILSECDIKIHALVLNKHNFNFKNFLFKNEVNKTYMYLVNDLISKISIKGPIDFKLDNFVPNSLENKFRSILLETLEENGKFSEVSFVFSQNWKCIQWTDLIAWCIFQYFENNNKIFLEKVKSNIYLKIYEK